MECVVERMCGPILKFELSDLYMPYLLARNRLVSALGLFDMHLTKRRAYLSIGRLFHSKYMYIGLPLLYPKKRYTGIDGCS